MLNGALQSSYIIWKPEPFEDVVGRARCGQLAKGKSCGVLVGLCEHAMIVGVAAWTSDQMCAVRHEPCAKYCHLEFDNGRPARRCSGFNPTSRVGAGCGIEDGGWTLGAPGVWAIGIGLAAGSCQVVCTRDNRRRLPPHHPQVEECAFLF